MKTTEGNNGGSLVRRVRRLGWIGKQPRINTTTGHRWDVWVITLSNGRKLCECETESAAKRIYKAISSQNDPSSPTAADGSGGTERNIGYNREYGVYE